MVNEYSKLKESSHTYSDSQYFSSKDTYPELARCMNIDQCERCLLEDDEHSPRIYGINILVHNEMNSALDYRWMMTDAVRIPWVTPSSPAICQRGLKRNPLRSTDRRHAQAGNPIAMVTNPARSLYRSFIRSQYLISCYHLLSFTIFCFQYQLSSLPFLFDANREGEW